VGLDDGGTTPNPDLVAAVKSALRIPIFVLVRARAGDFVYSRGELATMAQGIQASIDAGADGIVTGALTRDARVDIDAMRTLMAVAKERPVTFHRAFDHLRDQARSLEDLMQVGVARVLTSGGSASASEGVDALARLVKQGADRVSVVAGGSVRAHNVAQILERTGVSEVHARLIDESTMRQLVDAVRMSDGSPTARKL
jgi:copper homeostasis protein